MAVPEISVQELKRRLDAGEPLQLIDVREPWECEIVALPQARQIPLQQLPNRLQELSKEGEVVAMCKSGGRSRRAAEFLQSAGFPQVTNVTGGIQAWIDEIDPTLPGY
jgi:adenylyltransferase/sulfurtransferase